MCAAQQWNFIKSLCTRLPLPPSNVYLRDECIVFDVIEMRRCEPYVTLWTYSFATHMIGKWWENDRDLLTNRNAHHQMEETSPAQRKYKTTPPTHHQPHTIISHIHSIHSGIVPHLRLTCGLSGDVAISIVDFSWLAHEINHFVRCPEPRMMAWSSGGLNTYMGAGIFMLLLIDYIIHICNDEWRIFECKAIEYAIWSVVYNAIGWSSSTDIDQRKWVHGCCRKCIWMRLWIEIGGFQCGRC